MQTKWQLYKVLPSFVLGFHGCDESIGESVLAGSVTHLSKSDNTYDWLGTGIYFWEANPQRAFEFASQVVKDGKVSKGKIKKPFVLGAIIDLRRCFNLIDSDALLELREGSLLALSAAHATNLRLQNKGEGLNLRYLDRAAIEAVHGFRKEKGFHEYDTVRSAFWEGQELYPSAGFREKNHIQLCVRNIDCIKGYFRPIEKYSK